MHRVVITGLGCVTPIGANPRELWHSVLAGRTGIVALPAGFTGLRFTRAGIIQDLPPDPASDLATTERGSRLALRAAAQAMAESRLTEHHPSHRIAILTGNSTTGRHAEEPEIAKIYKESPDLLARAHPLTVIRSMSSNAASHVAIAHGITGPSLNLSTACASGNHALGTAFRMIRSGEVSAALAGGHESPLTLAFCRAWDSMRVVSPTACRPFAADRDGMTLAEGAAYLALETLQSARSRNALVYAEIVGFGMSTDAFHITQPKPEGIAAAMQAALADASITFGRELTPSEIGYISAHGTGTETNDRVEAAAIASVFGSHRTPVSGTKALHGHAIGASPAMEAILTALALHHGILPHNAGLETPDPAARLDLIRDRPRSTGATIALSNALAFGGLNTCLGLRTWQP